MNDVILLINVVIGSVEVSGLIILIPLLIGIHFLFLHEFKNLNITTIKILFLMYKFIFKFFNYLALVQSIQKYNLLKS